MVDIDPNAISQNIGSTLSALPGQLATVQKQGQDQYNNFINGYKGFTQGLENPESMYQRVGQQYNVPQLQQAANTTNNLIANMPYTQRVATQGFNVNQNQLDRSTASQIAKLQPVAQTENTALNTAQNNVSAQMGYGMQGQQTQLLPYQSQAQSLPAMIAQQQTGWTDMMGQELSGLLSQFNAGVTMSEGDKNRAAQLAMTEQNYQNQMNLNAQQNTSAANIANIQNERFRTLGRYGSIAYDANGNPVIMGGSNGGGTTSSGGWY